MRFKAIIFDLDGTLLDTLEDIADSMNTVLKSNGFPVHDVEKYRYFIGNGLANLARVTLPEEKRSDATVKSALDAMLKEYAKGWANKTRPYDGILELLENLQKKGLKMCVFSNKTHDFTEMMIKHFFPGYEFKAVFGARPGVPQKPDPYVPLEISGMLGIEPGHFLYLGDTSTDMKTANASEMFAVGALWGFRQADELLENGAKALIKHPLELISLLD